MQLLKSRRTETPSLIARSSQQHFMTEKAFHAFAEGLSEENAFPGAMGFPKGIVLILIRPCPIEAWRVSPRTPLNWRTGTRPRSPPADKKRPILLSSKRIIRSPPQRTPPQIMPGRRMPAWKASLPIAGFVI